ncbi:hypothetical protein FA95DRAFT_1578821, partial [Auriscalpium vulgare]
MTRTAPSSADVSSPIHSSASSLPPDDSNDESVPENEEEDRQLKPIKPSGPPKKDNSKAARERNIIYSTAKPVRLRELPGPELARTYTALDNRAAATSGDTFVEPWSQEARTHEQMAELMDNVTKNSIYSTNLFSILMIPADAFWGTKDNFYKRLKELNDEGAFKDEGWRDAAEEDPENKRKPTQKFDNVTPNRFETEHDFCVWIDKVVEWMVVKSGTKIKPRVFSHEYSTKKLPGVPLFRHPDIIVARNRPKDWIQAHTVVEITRDPKPRLGETIAGRAVCIATAQFGRRFFPAIWISPKHIGVHYYNHTNFFMCKSPARDENLFRLITFLAFAPDRYLGIDETVRRDRNGNILGIKYREEMYKFERTLYKDISIHGPAVWACLVSKKGREFVLEDSWPDASRVHLGGYFLAEAAKHGINGVPKLVKNDGEADEEVPVHGGKSDQVIARELLDNKLPRRHTGGVDMLEVVEDTAYSEPETDSESEADSAPEADSRSDGGTLVDEDISPPEPEAPVRILDDDDGNSGKGIRKHSRLLTTPERRPIYHFQNRSELVRGIIDIVTVHEKLYNTAHILTRDMT